MPLRGMNTTDNANLADQELWQAMLEVNLDEFLTNVPFVRQIAFGTGEIFTLPSIGDAVTRDLPEGTSVTFDGLDSGEVQVVKEDTVVAAISLSEKFMEDSRWTAELLTEVPNRITVALMEEFESRVFRLQSTQSQGTGNANNINGFPHRLIATGPNETIIPQDFASARLSLKKAKVFDQGLVAIVDPTVAFALETLSALATVSDNPRWEGIVANGLSQNMRFVKNVYGFDVWESNLLDDANETIGSLTTTAGKANLFMSVARESILPFVVAWVKRPQIETKWDMIEREQQVVGTTRWGRRLTREANLVVIISDTDAT